MTGINNDGVVPAVMHGVYPRARSRINMGIGNLAVDLATGTINIEGNRIADSNNS